MIGRLEGDWESLSAQVETIDKQLKELLQQRGALVEQQRTAAADQSLAEKQLDLDIVSAQIVEKVDAWRERAAVGILLDEIRDEYEKFRQPETLREASTYMAKLTGGKYTRIWTPLANDILLVDTADGNVLPVEVLSRGTREQLFVSLRLALVAAFARRGIHLPMILDDVFVNFDAGRTKIAVSVLREFAREGHQLLVFTCHEHVWRLFADVQADTRRIPNRYNKNEEIVDAEVEPLNPNRLSRPLSSNRSQSRSKQSRPNPNRNLCHVCRGSDHRIRTGARADRAASRRSGILLAGYAEKWQAEHERPARGRAAASSASLARGADDPSARLVVNRGCAAVLLDCRRHFGSGRDARFFLERVRCLRHQRTIAAAGVGIAHAEKEIRPYRSGQRQAHAQQRLPRHFFPSAGRRRLLRGGWLRADRRLVR